MRWSLFALVLLIVRGAFGQDEKLYQGDHQAMGTTYTLLVYAREEGVARQAFEAAFEEIDRVDELLSNYKPGSEISRINREAADHEVTTDPETFAFLKQAMHLSEQTDGAFDITVGRLLKTWGFFSHAGKVPAEAQSRADAAGVGWRHVRLDAAARTVRFEGSLGLELDPGGIGKGYAVDRVVAILRGIGVTRAFLSAGSSSVYAIGAPPGKDGWPVEIKDPRRDGAVLETVMLRDTSLSTSACTEKFFVEAGHAYCHIFDPRTLRPVEGMLQTTIVSPSATLTDALSTGLFVLTPAESVAALEKFPGVSAVIVAGDKAAARMTVVRWAGSDRLEKAFAKDEVKR